NEPRTRTREPWNPNPRTLEPEPANPRTRPVNPGNPRTPTREPSEPREPANPECHLHSGSAEVVVRVATFAAATLLAAGSVFAQTPEPVAPLPQTPTFRSGAALVSLNVTVQNGPKYVTGLQPADFAVYEDGVKQDVRFFEADAVPVDLIVLIDTSASMIDKLDVVHEAAAGFVKTLRATDRGAVV